MQIPVRPTLGGWIGQFTTIRYALEVQNLRAPHTGEPPTEAFLFGLSGGIGFSYFPYLHQGSSPLDDTAAPLHFIEFTARYRRPMDRWMADICQSLGVPFNRFEATEPSETEQVLYTLLEAGIPPIVFVSGNDPMLNFTGETLENCQDQPVMVLRLLEEQSEFELGTCSYEPVRVSRDHLASLRTTSPNARNLIVHLDEMEEGLREEKLRESVRECLHRGVYQMLHPPQPRNHFGLRGMGLFAKRIAQQDHHHGWPRMYSEGYPFYRAMVELFQAIEYHCVAPGGGRPLYAGFLREAGVILEEPLLAEAGAMYRDISENWLEVSDAALPDSVPLFEDTKILLRRKFERWRKEGQNALPHLQQIGQDMQMLEQEAREAFPLDESERLELLQGVSDRVKELHRKETEAAQAMNDMLGM
jgi:hypothetical protein